MQVSSGPLPLQIRVKNPTKFARFEAYHVLYGIEVQKTKAVPGGTVTGGEGQQQEAQGPSGGNDFGNQASGAYCGWGIIEKCSTPTANGAQGAHVGYCRLSGPFGAQGERQNSTCYAFWCSKARM